MKLNKLQFEAVVYAVLTADVSTTVVGINLSLIS